MTILESNMTSDSITLETFTPFTRVVLNHGVKLLNSYEETGLSVSEITITKESLGLETLDNTYFKVEVFDADSSATVGLYIIDVINDKEAALYNANKLKQDLDNLNYYDGLLETLNNKLDFLTANDTFFNYLDFLENKINANNFLHSIGRQD